MGYKLFLDDVRDVSMVYKDQSDSDYIVVRSYKEFVECIKMRGLPSFVSFDNDLGQDELGMLLPDGYDAVKWLVFKSGLDLRKLNYRIHSANPIASVQIDSLLKNYIAHLRKIDQSTDD